MTIPQTFNIADVLLFDALKHSDERGDFCETFRQAWLTEALGQKVDFCQHNLVSSKQGTLRGLHFQRAPYAQAKLLQVLEGEIFDVMVDLRRSSQTFGQHLALRLTADQPQTLYIPPGLAHGYLVLSEVAKVFYQVDGYYQPEADAGLAYDDPCLAINWPKLACPYLLSAKDRQHPTLSELDKMGGLFD